MASHLFSRPNTAKNAKLVQYRRNRLRRVILESLERRELMAADLLGLSDVGGPVSYSLAGQAGQPLAFTTSSTLGSLSADEVTTYLNSTLGSSSAGVTSSPWFPLIQESYSNWSQQNGLAYSYSTGLVAEGEGDGLIGEGEAGGPRLLSVAPNSGNIFSFNNVNTITEAPTELVFRFDGASGISQTTIANGIKLIRAGRDGSFGDANDQVITPGFLGFGDNNKIVVMRFATTLPDDLYRVVVIGADNGALGETAIRNTANLRLDNRLIDSTPADITRDTVDFKLELGALVKAVVPQPVDRLASSTVNLFQTGIPFSSFSLQVFQGDTTDNVAGTSVGLRLVQGAGPTTTASYDKATNRITVNVATGETVTGIANAINAGTGVVGNFSVTNVVNGANVVNALDLSSTPRTVSFTNWSLDPKRDQIRIYFNDDDLLASSATNPAFYQLILTQDTVQPGDDVIIPVQSVAYDPLLDLATLTFAQPIDQIAGTYRLRIGGNDVVANNSSPAAQKTLIPTTPVADPGGDASSALALGTLSASASVILNQSVITTSTAALPLNFPGTNFEPGHRDIQDESHVGGPDGNSQISTIFYNFALNRSYGTGSDGQPVNTILQAGDEGLDRIREIFEYYSLMLGVDFVESESAGYTVVVGDMFPNGRQSGPGGVIGVAGGGLAIMDSAEVWDYSFGGQSGIPGAQNFFTTAMHELGHLLGLGHTYDLPPGTIMGSEGDLADPNPGIGSEWVFPGDADVIHGQNLYRPDNRDIDAYSFTIPGGASGTFTAETIAERLPNSSNLDSYLSLMKKTAIGYEVIAVNNDSFSSDSFLSLKLTAGDYLLSVTGKGNENFNPLIANTGDGASSQGAYQLKLDFKADADSQSMVDLNGTALDGDGDGLSGGNFDFWFRSAAPAGIALPGQPKTIFVDKGFGGSQTGPLLGSAAQPFNNLDFTNPVKWPVGFLQPGDIVRVVGSLGADRRLSTSADNPAYEIGRGGVGNAILSDGLTLDVPQGVTVMVDAGAIFKLRNSRVATGSINAGINNSFSALQVLGTTRQTVNFTSYEDQSQGVDTNPLVTTPQAGDWGGLDLHNDLDRQEGRGDYERKGIFLNYLSHADIRYGGGQITVVSPSPSIAPINLSESRPTLLYNNIRFSVGAAISADPNSFEETLFTEPQYQQAQVYRPDYNRIGPDLRGNLVTNNSINGLFVRTSTAPGAPLTTLTTAARFDDRDITHVLGQNLIISGTPGGSFLETTAPDVSLVQTFDNLTITGALTPGQTVQYKVTFVDLYGGQSIPSVATADKLLATSSLDLTNLPTAQGVFVGRRLWRSTDGVTFTLVAELDRGTTTYTDRGASLGATLASAFATSSQRARPDARLQVDPGLIVKTVGSRIEVGISAQLIAEGTPDHKVVFTSRDDDRYGAGGTFDTNGDGSASNPGAGDWGGLVARPHSSISVDYALITYGGGVTSVSGGFAGFNAVEIYEADGRIANSVLENNASGLGGDKGATRDGRGPHDASVIFVAGRQPVIIDNIFRGNSVTNTAAISINANAMTTRNVQDLGRQTGLNDRTSEGLGNAGPLVQGNRLLNNGLNGLRVRGQTLTTAAAWDDTDIVHILQSEIIVPDLHTYGGMRLQSKVDEGLVVKLGANAGITTLGRPLDITDRVGGSLQIIGAPGFPVVLTGLADDSVGAGFDPNGSALLDTNNNGASTGTPGSWRSIKFEPYTNDRNLDTTFEYEPDQIQDVGTNDTPTAAQNLGALAATLSGGDENLRLGFTLHGSVAAPQDLDVYSFSGTAGTPIWFDLDQTNGALDTVIELIDSNGNIMAQSNNSLQESVSPALLYVTPDTSKITPEKVQPLDQEPFSPVNSFQGTDRDLYSVNPFDAGMRVVLPGTAGATNTYYLRVRSSNLKPGDPTSKLQDPSQVRSGLTTGAYRLQVRMQQNDETAGTTVRFADIRFATNGIEANGMPAHSPLLGQVGEIGDAANGVMPVLSPQSLGNIANADRGSVSLAGSLNAANDVDIYLFTVSRDSTQQVPGNGGTHISTIFDIDYADGLGRPDTTLWVYRLDGNGSNPVLVLMGSDSNIADDRPAPGQSADLDALSRGSVGARDPFIGASELPPGQYWVAVTNNSLTASAMQQFQQAGAANQLVRLEPVNSVNRLFVDRIGTSSPDTAAGNTPVLFTTSGSNGGIDTANSVPWTLADLTTYVVRDQGNGSRLIFANAMTGAQSAEISDFVRVNDAAMSPDGRLVGYEIPVNVTITDANSGNFHVINSIGAAAGAGTPTGASTNSGNSGIVTYTAQQTAAGANPTFAVQPRDQNGLAGGNTPQGDGIQFNGLTFYTVSDSTATLQMFGVGSRGNLGSGGRTFNFPTVDGNGAVTGIDATRVNYNTTNIVYRLDPTTGAAINPAGAADRTGAVALTTGAGTQKVEFGRFLSGTLANDYTDGVVTGLTEIGGTLYAVSNLGELFIANVGSGTSGFGPNFTSPDPARVYSGRLPSTVINDNFGNPIVFTGLTAGPRNLEGGRFANMLFGTTADGTIWAFNTNGVKQPIFPGFSASIKSNSAALGTTVSGIDFSPLDVNLWHQTNTRTGDAGHGRTVPFDNSQANNLQGNNSLYFGFEDGNRGANNRQQGTWQGVYNVAAYQGTYNLPGGAKGAIVSNPIDLRGYSSADLPTLYFNYFLATEDANSTLVDGDVRMRDAFRVYAAGENGNWILLTTNNSATNGNRNNNADEFDTSINQNADPFGNPLYTQDTFDNTGSWRQARVSLSALAGQENVRLRFEFSTGATFNTGNPLLGGVELTAVAGAKLSDGQRFTVTPQDGVSAVGARTFELDMGLVLDLPGGASIVSGLSQIVIAGTTITFSTSSNTGNDVQYVATDTPTQVATKLRTRLPAILGIPAANITANSLRPNILNISGLASVPASFVNNMPATVVVGQPGVAAGNVQVPVNQSMTETQIRDAIRLELARTFNVGNDTSAAGLAVWPIFANTLRLFKFQVTNNTSGLALVTSRSGDQFGVQNAGLNRLDEVAQSNAFEGVYIDDIIVGFAERGEMVFNDTTGTSVANAGFVANTNYATTAFATSQVEQGRYQLTVRTAAEYGQESNPVDGRITLARSYNTNDRLAQQVGIQVAANAAGQIRDGITFTLSDGVNQATFEFDVTVAASDIATGIVSGNIPVRITANATPTQIATAIRNAINSSTAQLVLKLSASLQGEMSTGSGDAAPTGSSFVVLHGAAATSRTGSLSISGTPFLTIVSSGGDTGFGEDLGDTERQREQGQLLLVSNTITNSSNYGIAALSGNRDQSSIGNQVGSRPYPGSPINLPTANTSGLAPGIVVGNNILANNTLGGLRVSGDATGDMQVPSLIARVVNNTFFGGTTALLVENGSSAMVLNNVFASAGTGVQSVSSNVVLGYNTFQSNGTNVVGIAAVNNTDPQFLTAADPLFVSTTNRRFYLAAGSQAIDSSIESLPELAGLTQVKNAIDLPLSPVLAPDVDVTGQRRVDDPTVNSPAGVGGNVFKDRGAVDRSDFIGLNAIILQPQDNDSSLLDTDRNPTVIRVTEGELEYFSILLQDTNGTGPDETSVNAPGSVTLSENGRLLIPGADYIFGYNANSRTIRLTPLAGIWRKDSVYEISLNNRNGTRLTVGGGATIADGAGFNITYPGGSKVFEFEKGSPAGVSSGAAAVKIQTGYTAYQVAAQLSAAINAFGQGLSSYLQGDGQVVVLGATSVAVSGTLPAPLSLSGIRDLAGNLLFPNRPNSLTQFTIVMPEVKLDFGDAQGANIATIIAPNSFVAPVVSNGDGARHTLLPIDVPLLALGQFADADADGIPSPSASSDSTDTLVSLGTLAGAVFGNTGSASITVNRAGIVDGQQFTITDGLAHPLAGVVFEFNDQTTAASSATVIAIQLDLTLPGDSSAIIAAKLANAVNSQVLAGKLDHLIAVVDPTGSASVRLVANSGYKLDIPVATAPALARLPIGNVSIDLSGVDLSTPAARAALDGQQFTITDGSGNTVNFELNQVPAAVPPAMVTAGFVGIDLDFTNPLTTTSTIASAIATAINNEISARNLVMGTAAVTDSTVFIKADDEDGVSFKGVFNAGSNVVNPVVTTVTSTGAGMIDAWIDWNGDGDFNDGGEQVIISQPVQAGANIFNLVTPAAAVPGYVNARFRLSTLGSALPSGVAIGGEVEDYLIEIIAGTPPVAVTDTYSTNEDTTLVVNTFASGVLGNDTDADNDPLAVPPILEPRFVFDENPATAAIDPLVNVSNGTLVLNLDGTFTYTPDLDFNGQDTFVYNVIDQRLRSNLPTTVTINVVAQNDAPLAFDDTIGQADGAYEDATVVVPGSKLTDNDRKHFAFPSSANASNENGQELRLKDNGASIISETTTSFGGLAGLGVRVAANSGQGAYGIRVIVLSSDLTLGVAPTVSVLGSTITVTLNSNVGSVSTVNDFIAAINGHPAASTLVTASLTTGVGGTPIGNVPTAYSPLVVPPSGGTVSVVGNQLTYTPPLHYNNNIGGPALLLVTIEDDASAGPVANLTSTATLTVNMAAVNDRPEYDSWVGDKEVLTLEVPNDNVGALVTVPNFITGILPGPVLAIDEATGPSLATPENQSISFPTGIPVPLVRALNPELFAVQPTITVVGNTGTLEFQLAQDVNKELQFTKILVEVIAQDSGAVGGVNNELNQSIARTFTILPTAINDAPEFTIPTVTPALEDQGVVVVPGFMIPSQTRKGPVTALDEAVQQTLSIQITGDVNAFTATGFPSIDLVTGDLTYQTAPHVNRYTGQNLNVTVTVIDDGGTALGGVDRTTKSFLIDVAEFNDAPEYVMPATITSVNEDPTPTLTTIPGFITGMVAGPAAATDEGPARENQQISFVVTARDPSLFDSSPGSLPQIAGTTDPNPGQLTYRLRKDINLVTPFPAIIVDVIAVDSGLPLPPTIVQFDPLNTTPRDVNAAVTQAFTILPTAVNDAPEFTIPTVTASLEDQGVVVVTGFMDPAQIRKGPTSALDEVVQILSIEITGDVNAFTATGFPSIDLVTGNLTYETAPHVNRYTGQNLNVTVTVIDDGGTALGGVDRTTKSFLIDVAEFNDAPEYVMPATITSVNEDPTPTLTTIPGFITGMVAGPAAASDEGPARENQQISFVVTARDPSLFDSSPGSLPQIAGTTDPNPGQLTYRLRKDINQVTPFPAIIVDVIAVDSGLPLPPTIVQFDPLNTTPRDVNAAVTRAFTILPTSVNDAPEFTFINVDPMVVASLEDEGFVTKGLIDPATIRKGPISAEDEVVQILSYSISADPNVFTVAGYPTLDLLTGNLTYQTAPNVNRHTPGLNFNVSVTLIDDGGTALGGVDRTTKSFSIDIGQLNDAPEYAMPTATSAYVEDPNALPGALTTVPNFVTLIQPGPSAAVDEGPIGENQQVEFVVTAVDPTLFDTTPGSLPAITGTTSANPGTLTYRLRKDINQITPFPAILVQVIAVDSGLPSPAVEQFDPLNSTPRNINAAATRTFTILPDPINDAPIFTFNPAVLDATKPAFPTINATEDQGVATVVDFLIDVLPGPLSALDELASQQIVVPILVEALDPSAFDGPSGQPALVLDPVTHKATLTFRTAPNVNEHTGQSLLVRVTVKDSAGVVNPGDDDTTVATFSISVAPVNDVPSFTLPIVPPALTPAVTVNEDNGLTTTLAFATNIVAGPATAVDETTIVPWKQTLFFDVTSNTNPSLFSTAPSIDPVTGNLSFRPAPEQNGQAVIVVQLRDQTNDGTPVEISPPQTFTINITPINDPPEFTPGSSYVNSSGDWVSSSFEDQGLVSRLNFATNLRVGPILATDEPSSQNFTVHVRALDPSAFSVQPAIAADGTLTYQTAPDVNSNQTVHDLRVEVFLTDNGTPSPLPHNNTSVVRTFTIAASAINDAPVFTLPSNQVNVIEDVEDTSASPGSPTTFNNFATNIAQAAGLLLTPPLGPTASDEASQILRFDILSVSAPELFEIQPTISPAGQLSFRTADHKNGKAVVVVQLVEPFEASSPAPNANASTRQTFTISLAPINDPPQFDLASVTVAEGAGLVSRNGFAFNVRRGPVGSEDENSQEIAFNVVAKFPQFFTVQPAIGVDGTLTFQTAPFINSVNSDLTVFVQLTDNGAATPPPNNNVSNSPLARSFVINVTQVNDPPIPDSFTAVIDEDQIANINAGAVLFGDRPGPTPDEDGQSMTMTQIERTTAKGGVVTPVLSGLDIISFTYQPPVNLVGTDTFLYVVTDNGVPARSGTGTITISLTGVNDPPQFIRGADQFAAEDAPLVTVPGWASNILPGPPVATDELNQSVSFNVTSNNSALFEVQPAISGNGTLSYKPLANANGFAVVTVIAEDSGSGVAPNVNQSAPQVFTISISAANDPPVFTPGPNIGVAEDSGAYSQTWASNIAPAAGLLLATPSSLDEAGQVVDFTVTVDNPSLFSVQPTISSSNAAVPGLLQFTPNRDAFGSVVVTVRAVDRGPSGGIDQNTSAPSTFTITINSANDAPVAVTDTYSTDENTLLVIAAPGLLANDVDVDLPNDSITAVPGVLVSALGAIVTINADGSMSYNSSAVTSIQQLTTGQSIQDSFTYTIQDNSLTTSNTGTVIINVAGVNDAPTAVDDNYTVGVGQSQFLDVLANDFDVDSPINPSTITVTSLPAFGTVVVNQTGVIQYTPGGGFRGIDSFRYTVRDSSGNVSNEALVSIVVNNAPIAQDDSASTIKNTPVDINVLANDSDLDGSLNLGSVQVVLNPAPSGTATVLPNGRIRFTPATDFAGLVNFSYVVSDDIGSVSNVANVSVRIQNSKWQNPIRALDVNADTFISPIDALLIINYLNSGAERDLTKTSLVPPPYLDTNGDERVSPVDALLVINYLNANRGGTSEGEGESDLSATTYAMMVTPQQMIATVGNQVVQEVQSVLDSSLLAVAAEDDSVGAATSLSFQTWCNAEEEEVVNTLSGKDEDSASLADEVMQQLFSGTGL